MSIVNVGSHRRWHASLFAAAFAAAVAGCVLVRQHPDAPWPYVLAGAGVAVAFAASRGRPIGPRLALVPLLLYPFYKGAWEWRHRQAAEADRELVGRLVTTEEVILELTPLLKTLSGSPLNLRLPDPSGRVLFADEVRVNDLPALEALDAAAPDGGGTSLVTAHRLEPAPGAGPATVAGERVDLWRGLLDRVDFFEHARFYLVDGAFPGEGFDQFEGDVGFSGLAQLPGGRRLGIKSRQSVRWERSGPADRADPVGSGWRIVSWSTRKLDLLLSERDLFSEQLDRAVPDPDDRRRARESLHYRTSIEYYRRGAEELPHRYFTPISVNQKPGLSVADVDGDGRDDLYVMVRLGRNLLFRNRGDGTFEECASRFGLDIAGHSTCGIFADFDNDGDPDLMLGRSLEPSLYLENLEGRFFAERDPGVVLPSLAISMAAADFNGDGLLDIHVCTYRPAVLGGASPAGGVASMDEGWPEEFLPAPQAAELRRRHQAAEAVPGLFGNLLDQVGPPNVLLANRGGGRFEVAAEGGALELWRNSLQATWSDFDGDGDPDLYVANDWAPDQLMRNDGPAGFVDVSRELGITAFGFAMGASWGDYDLDGRHDLYVSNMFSKAGRRITGRLDGIGSEFVESAAGNYLYRRTAEGFELVSGLEPPALTVAQAGWSWGGQLGDVDNDGFPDLHALSGYFSAPDPVASQLDL